MKSALDDIKAGSLSWHIWSRLGWHDILSRYRRSIIGPLWLMLTLLAFIIALSVVYGTIFNAKLSDYIPIVASGMLYWTLFSAAATEGPNTFVESEAYIKSVRQPLFLYVCRILWRNLIVFSNNLVVAFLVIIIFKGIPSDTFLLIIPGTALFVLNIAWIVLLTALLGVRFRDLQPLIATILQTVFFVTPIFWSANLLGARRWIVDFNPIYHLIEVARAPMLNEYPSIMNYGVVVGITIVGWGLALALYSRFHKRIVYWL